MIINAGLIEENTAPTSGGGIYISDSELKVGRSGEECWDNQRCNFFRGNHADDLGGAISAAGESELDISDSTFEQNTADKGAVLRASSREGGGNVRIEGAVINNNGDDTSESILHVETGSGLDIIHSTIADNTISTNDASRGIIEMEQIFSIDLPGDEEIPALAVNACILDNPGFDNLSHNRGQYSVDLRCIIGHEVSSLSAANNLVNQAEGLAGGAYITQINPAFVDRNNRDYKLLASSPAIDFCNTPANAEVRYKDIDFQDRGWDDPTHPDNHFLSFYDLGADERVVTTTTTTTLPSGNDNCGDANSDSSVTATDALFALRAAVGTAVCEPCICDVDGSGSVAASDALAVLRAAVGQSVDLQCPVC